jgi:hypothetical protein
MYQKVQFIDSKGPACKIMNIIRTGDFTTESGIMCGARTIKTQIKKIKINGKLLLNAAQMNVAKPII